MGRARRASAGAESNEKRTLVPSTVGLGQRTLKGLICSGVSGSEPPPRFRKPGENNHVESSISSRLSLETFAEETEQPLAFWARTNKVGHLL